MNAVGELGNLMIKNQNVIEIILLSILGIIALVYLVKAIMNTRKQKCMLEEISEEVKKIHEELDNLQKNKLTVDGKTIRKIPIYDVKFMDDNKPSHSKKKREEGDKKGEATEEVIAPKKFFSTDCGIDKQGNSYTEEELIEKIN